MATSACSQAASIASLNGLTALLAAGATIKIFSGVQPANCELPDTGVLLSSGMTASGPVFGAAVANATPRGAIATANAVGSDNNAVATGTAGYWRAYDSLGACVLQGTCVKTGQAGAMILNTTTIIAGATVSILLWTIVQPNGS